MPARIEIARHAYLPEYTLGWMHYNGLKLATIERPWIPVREHKGGKPRESCVPDGNYKLIRHSSNQFPDVVALINEELDVYYQPSNRPGRYTILIHQGNWVRNVIGCIAIGMRHGVLQGERAVLESGKALNELRASFANGLPSLTIRAIEGTSEFTAR